MKKDSGYSQTIKQSGMRLTRGKLAVLGALETSPLPLSIKQIQGKLKRMRPDQATLYRTVELLKQAGIIRQIHLEHDHAHYELASTRHHHHAVCQKCSKITEVDVCLPKTTGAQIKKVSDFKTLNYHTLEFFGVCKKCQNKSAC